MRAVRAGVLKTSMRALVVLVALALAPNVAAIAGTIAGDTVDIEYLFPTSSSLFGLGTTGVVTSSGVGLNLFDNQEVTVFPDHVDMTGIKNPDSNFQPATFNGVSVTDLTHPGAFTSASADPASTVVSFGNSNVSIQGGVLFINYQGLDTPFGSLARVGSRDALIGTPTFDR